MAHIRTRTFLAIATAAAFLPTVLEILSQFFLTEASQRIAVQAACCRAQRGSGEPVLQMRPGRFLSADE
jgi:hypothetical protein